LHFHQQYKDSYFTAFIVVFALEYGHSNWDEMKSYIVLIWYAYFLKDVVLSLLNITIKPNDSQ
jgi:hypothetical protein